LHERFTIVVAIASLEAGGQLLGGGDMNCSGGEINDLIERQGDDVFIHSRTAAVAMIHEREDERDGWRAARGNPRRIGPPYAIEFTLENLERAKGFEPSTPTLAMSLGGLRHSIFFYPRTI
jgi:hypothetical protein